MEFPEEDIPVRQFMDDPDIQWRTGSRPDYTQVNSKFLKERRNRHPAGSLERTVEDLVKTFEMEATHKINPKDWGSVDVDKFKLIVNGDITFTLNDVIERGTYNTTMAGCPLYDAENTTWEESHALFRKAMPSGFAWEILQVFSGPPTVACTWRHWSEFKGHYNDTPPSGQQMELYGMTIITLSEKMNIEQLEMFFDASQFIQTLRGGKCPINH